MILNGLPWKQTEITLSFLRFAQVLHFNSFVDYEGYFVSFKEFLPILLDIMII